MVIFDRVNHGLNASNLRERIVWKKGKISPCYILVNTKSTTITEMINGRENGERRIRERGKLITHMNGDLCYGKWV